MTSGFRVWTPRSGCALSLDNLGINLVKGYAKANAGAKLFLAAVSVVSFTSSRARPAILKDHLCRSRASPFATLRKRLARVAMRAGPLK